MRLTMEGDVLHTPAAGRLVIRGAAVRGLGYGVGVLLVAAASVFLLRYLGVEDFGRFATIMSLIAIMSGVTDAGLTAVGARPPPSASWRPAALARELGQLEPRTWFRDLIEMMVDADLERLARAPGRVASPRL
jgi:hypothetical protein